MTEPESKDPKIAELVARIKRRQLEKTWSLVDAVSLINELLPEAQAAGWGLGLHGSVLYRGYSSADVDVIAYPLQKRADALPRLEDLQGVLDGHGFRLKWDVADVQAYWRVKGILDEKRVQVYWTVDNMRIDRHMRPLGMRRLDLFIMDAA